MITFEDFMKKYNRVPSVGDMAVEREYSLSRFQLLERPIMNPGQCAICASGAPDRKYVDFGLSVDFYGAFYVCVICLTEAMEVVISDYRKHINSSGDASESSASSEKPPAKSETEPAEPVRKVAPKLQTESGRGEVHKSEGTDRSASSVPKALSNTRVPKRVVMEPDNESGDDSKSGSVPSLEEILAGNNPRA